MGTTFKKKKGAYKMAGFYVEEVFVTVVVLRSPLGKIQPGIMFFIKQSSLKSSSVCRR